MTTETPTCEQSEAAGRAASDVERLVIRDMLDAEKEFVRLAAEIRQSHTVSGEWDGTEPEAEEEYNRLIGMACNMRRHARHYNGWAIIPTEATDEMLLELIDEGEDMATAAERFKAMLASV